MRAAGLAALLVFATGACALGQAGPRIQLAETVHDFGRVPATAPLRYDFIFTNTGSAALEITDVRAGCQCTTPGPWDRKVEPGRTGKIPIQFDPARFDGPISKQVATVTCNDPTQSVLSLSVKANVWRPVTVEPTYANFVGIEGETTNETKIVRITSHLDEPLTLEPPQSPSTAFKPKLKILTPGKQFELQVTYDSSATDASRQGIITVKTSSTNMPVISVNALAILQPALVVMPQHLRVAAPPLPANYRQPVTIHNNGKTPIQLSEATVNAKGVTVQTVETQPGKLFSLNLNFPTNFHAPPEQALELTVKTTHPRQPLLRVPILQTPGARSAIVRPLPVAR